jgi:hypothetical protein
LYTSGRTTGFIIWLNGYGVLVDPPMQTTEFLRRHVRTEAPYPSFFSASRCGVVSRPNQIDAIVGNPPSLRDQGDTHALSQRPRLGRGPDDPRRSPDLSRTRTNAPTHTRPRALFALIRSCSPGEKIELYTTRTVNESYKRKVNAITGLADVGEYYTFRFSLTCRTRFIEVCLTCNMRCGVASCVCVCLCACVSCEKCRPVLIGDKVNIHGAEFEFDYSFHTVPTVRFKLSFLGKSISYSSDTYYNPQVTIFIYLFVYLIIIYFNYLICLLFFNYY